MAQLEVRFHHKYAPDGQLNVVAFRLFTKLNAGLGYSLDSFAEIAEFFQNGKTVGIVALNISPHEIYLDVYAPECNFTRSALGQFFDHVFSICPRATAIVSSENKQCQKFLARLGFVCEGRARRSFDGKADSLFYGLLIADWKKSRYYKK